MEPEVLIFFRFYFFIKNYNLIIVAFFNFWTKIVYVIIALSP